MIFRSLGCFTYILQQDSQLNLPPKSKKKITFVQHIFNVSIGWKIDFQKYSFILRSIHFLSTIFPCYTNTYDNLRQQHQNLRQQHRNLQPQHQNLRPQHLNLRPRHQNLIQHLNMRKKHLIVTPQRQNQNNNTKTHDNNIKPTTTTPIPTTTTP